MNISRRIGAAIWVALLLAAHDVGNASEPSAPSSRARLVELSDEFQVLYAAADYQAALPVAREMVALLEPGVGLERELAGAYERLARVEIATGDAVAAAESLQRALELLGITESIASPRLIPPLVELAAAYRVQGAPEQAEEVLTQALTISHRAYGLFDARQLELIEQLIALYLQSGDADAADREMYRSLMVGERVYGFEDPRLLPLLERLARRGEETGRMAEARQWWMRTVEIASIEDEGRNAATITGLLGVSRSHRLQFVLVPRTMQVNTCRTDPQTGQPRPLNICTQLGRELELDEEGEGAALRALAILESSTSPPPVLMAATLLELGDWYITDHEPEVAMAYYRRAWPLFESLATTTKPNPLRTPRPMDYRTPNAAVRPPSVDGTTPAATPIQFSLTILPDGRTADITPLTEAADARLARIRKALEKARFRPRFEDGEPVETQLYRFTEFWEEPTPYASASAQGDQEGDPRS